MIRHIRDVLSKNKKWGGDDQKHEKNKKIENKSIENKSTKARA
jgi:hypothetical protein